MAHTESSLVAGGKPMKAMIEVNQQFNVSQTVRELHRLMGAVTAKEITPETVNAACHCVSEITSQMRTAVHAARYLSGADTA